MKRIITLALLIMSTLSFGSIKSLSKYTEILKKHHGHEFIYSNKLKIKEDIKFSGKWTKKNSEELFSHFLDLNKLAAVRTKAGIYKLIEIRDVRYHVRGDSINASFDKKPKLYDTFSYQLVKYHFKKNQLPEVGSLTSRSIRPFLSRYGRVINVSGSNYLVLLEHGGAIDQAYSIIKSIDLAPTKERAELLKKIRKINKKVSQKKSK